MQPPMPSLPIERGRPGPGLLAQVLVAKFCDHTPLHRQAGIYTREGVELDHSTLPLGGAVSIPAGPLGRSHWPPRPRRQVLHADDTALPCWRPAREKPGPVGCGWSCVMNARSDRIFHRPRIIATRRTARHPRPGAARPLPRLPSCRWLCRLRQSLSAHHAGRRAAADRGGVLSHVRRKFYDIHHASASPIAREAMERIAALFVIETSVRGQAPDRRLAARVQYARPRLDSEAIPPGSLKRISGKSALAELSATPSHDGTRCCATSRLDWK